MKLFWRQRQPNFMFIYIRICVYIILCTSCVITVWHTEAECQRSFFMKLSLKCVSWHICGQALSFLLIIIILFLELIGLSNMFAVLQHQNTLQVVHIGKTKSSKTCFFWHWFNVLETMRTHKLMVFLLVKVVWIVFLSVFWQYRLWFLNLIFYQN